MTPDEKKPETRFKCPNCQQPIVSRFTYCKQCATKFGRDTLFSCPRCGALVKQLERVCPGCQARLTDWGIGAEWLKTPVVSKPETAEPDLETEAGPIISKPLSEIQKPKESATAPTPVQTPLQRTAPSKISRAEALGRTNGLKHGRINGTKKGLVNGTSKGRINGTKSGLVNGTKQGRVNGFKGTKVGEVKEEEQSFLREKIAGKVPMWQAVAAFVVVLILVTSAVILSIQPSAGPTGIVIDGQFSDWASISSYKLSDVLPGNIPQVIESKMNVSGDRINVYLRLQDNAFSGSTPSSYHIFIDADSNVNTGYLLADHMLGADRMVVLSGWDGRLMETTDSNYTDSSDTANWSAWYSIHHTSAIQSLSEIEMSIPSSSGSPLVQIMTAGAVGEFSTPIMSNHGTIVAKQTSLLAGQVASAGNQSVIRVSVRAMGVPEGNYAVTATISNATGTDLASQILQISPSNWTTADFALDLSSLSSGESFAVNARLSSTVFAGPLDVDGEPITGYYLAAPSGIVIDGVFGDWTGRTTADIDTVAVENPNIDIAEYGACTQNNSHFFYVGMQGEALGGADVPEERGKPSSGGGNPTPIVRLRKTGEDLLQVFIDKDPGNWTGKIVTSGSMTIGADYLVEVFGQKGHPTTRSVMQWSSSTSEWIQLGDVKEIGVGGHGIELSVTKALLGNLTASEVIIYTTDWKARSDDCWFNGELQDPWVITSSGSSYQSVDGITWATSGSVTLQGSGSDADTKIVDMIFNMDRNRVWAISDHGRIYTNVSGSNTWTTNLTVDLRSNPDGNPVKAQGNPISDVIAITNYKAGQSNFVYLLTKRGYIYFTKSGIDESSALNPVYWKNDTRRVGAFTDFDDFIYASSNYYAMRSGLNTSIYYGASGAFTPTTVTGSSRTQTHMAIYPGASRATDTIFVLTDQGAIRRSTDGGTSWSAFGNLPVPSGGGNNTATYVGIDLDPSNIIWVVTDNGWVYKSTAALGGTFVKTQHLAYTGIVAIVGLHSIPEFSDLLVPIAAIIVPAVFISRKRRRIDGGSDSD
jgi:hypothetical protein